MALSDDLTAYVKTTFRTEWETRKGQVVPGPEDLKLSNDAIEFEPATVLYDDLSVGSQSTRAAKCAFKINYACPKGSVYDRLSPIRAARTGVRGDNDLVWVGLRRRARERRLILFSGVAVPLAPFPPRAITSHAAALNDCSRFFSIRGRPGTLLLALMALAAKARR